MINKTNTKFADTVLSMINDAAQASKNPNIVITSGLREPKDQAKAMADNLYNNVRINYKWAGQQIIAIFDKYSLSKPRNEIEGLMESKIIDLARQGNRVSAHCVPKEIFDKCNILDISCKAENLPNPRDFVKELIKEVKLVKVLTPFVDTDYKDSRVIKEINEPCIHIEINV